ncbi:TonB-dependent Receptor Plug Domain [Pedobacter sp. ok626]|uniref:TonB-dependent receptor n=1 Tax=Pedobacter sp. ok626 TaxID=1761882 RepID=UPI00088E4B81|nr:TonB-dependent receptor [Pedobacter sp. ok626]SDK91731.1 TonB-dependent Receptor Plug Domain [Pedobacter sp. ok626]
MKKKLTAIMRISTVVLGLLIGFSSLIVARETKAQNLNEIKVTINIKDENMAAVLARIEKSTGIAFSYDKNLLSKLKVSAQVYRGASLPLVLGKLLRQTGYDYEVINNNVVIGRSRPAPRPAEPGRISGKVVDSKGEPLPGASIRVLELNQTVANALDGGYRIALPPGSYTLEASYIGFQSKQITDVKVLSGQNTSLDIVLKEDSKSLNTVVVTSSYKKASVEGLYARQKNAATVTDGISAEQISATPDKNIGETLKRITGVSTTDNKNVVVRGAAERYNVAQLDGIMLPSTDVQSRNFDFSLIPSNLVESVVVSKSATPDMNAGFGGGLIQVNTISIPTENFLSFSAGASVNSRTTGQDFYGYQRGKYDYLGFDDGSRDHFPKGLKDVSSFNPKVVNPADIKAVEVAEQNRRIGGTERLGSRIFQSRPSQNYQFSLGRSYELSKQVARKIGFVGSLSYRNTQNIENIDNIRRGTWQIISTPDDPENVNTGHLYNFNTTLGALLNGGYRDGKHQIIFNNFYSRAFSEQLERISGWRYADPKDDGLNKHPLIKEDDRPMFTDLLQNKVSGEHLLGRIKLDWSAARVSTSALEIDAITATLRPEEMANRVIYKYTPGQGTVGGGGGILERDKFVYKERNLTVAMNAAVDFKIAGQKQIFKTGVFYLDRHASYEWTMLPIVSFVTLNNPYGYLPVQDYGNYMGMEHPMTDVLYMPSAFQLNRYEGKDVNKAVYAMLDNRLTKNLRLVWGGRFEYFRYDSLQNSTNMQDRPAITLADSVRWKFMPSAHLTYTPVNNLNVRFSYAKTAVRPSLMDNSRFSRYNTNFGRMQVNLGLESSIIDNYDLKLEWFPGAGDIISVGAFYKYFDKPAEFYAVNSVSGTDNLYVYTNNSDWGKIRGIEFEVRKSLGFISPSVSLLKDITVSGNLTLLKSEVQSRILRTKSDDNGKEYSYYEYMKYKRPLYGQVPTVVNAGLNYTGKHLGLNLVFNYMGYKTYITGVDPNLVEYERPRSQMDAQVSYRLYRNKMQFKLNISNLMDNPYRFYVNDASTFEIKNAHPPVNSEWDDVFKYKWGFSDKYEEGYVDYSKGVGQQIGDRQTLTRYIGRSVSLSLSYNF